MNDDDRDEREPRSRLDLAGRLFHPHWNLFRGAQSSTSKLGSTRKTRQDADEFKSALHPVDVICGGMYRACSTWQYEVVAHLIEQHLGGQRLGYLTGEEYAALVSSDLPDSQNESGQEARWRAVKSHDRDPSFSRAIAQERAIAIYAYRDVREVVFSLMHKRGMTFEQLLRHGMIHQILANDRFWMAQPDVLTQRYEDLLTEPASGVAELAHYLGNRLESSEADRIAGEYSHEANRARTEALRLRLQEAGVNLESAANAQICDSTTLLHWNHIRQRDSRSWHALANPRQRLVLERLCGRWLRARGYAPDPNENGKPKVSVHERAAVELDLMVALANFMIRSASQRFPRTARVVKRILGLPVDTPIGASAWADSPASHSRAKRTGEPHISFTAKPGQTDQDVAANESHIQSD